MSGTYLRVSPSSSTFKPKGNRSKTVPARDKLRRNLHLAVQELKVVVEPRSCTPLCYDRNPQHQVFNRIISSNNNINIVARHDLEEICVLGRGNYGLVYKVRHRLTSTIYALKVIQEEIGTHADSTNPCLSQEIEILTCTDSPFLVKCHGILEPKVGEKAILMEYMEAGALDTLLRNNGSFPEFVLAHIAYQVLNGLSYLHARNIVHLDIKPANLLVNKDLKVKIGDFGVSKIVDSTDINNKNLSSQGTCAYMSPERLDSETFGSSGCNIFAGDVWSLGVTLLELYVGHFPFFPADKRPNWMELVMEICFGELDAILPSQASEEFLNFLKCCLIREPSKRSTVSQLLCHPYICMEREPITPSMLFK